MFRHVFAASVILMSVTSLGLAQNATLYFAQFGNGSLGAISLKSEIVLANPSPTEIARGTVTFFQADGSLFATGVVGEGSTSSVSFVVPPLGSTTISTTGQGELGAGTAVVTFDGDLGAVIRFEIRGPAGVGSGIAGVPSSQIQSGFVAPARRVLNGINTGVAVRNVGEGEVTLNLSLRGEDGAEIPNGSVSRIVGGSGQLVEFIDTLFPSADTSPDFS